MNTEKSDTLMHAVPADWAQRAHADAAKYDSMYAASISTPETFWAKHGKRINCWGDSSEARRLIVEAIGRAKH